MKRMRKQVRPGGVLLLEVLLAFTMVTIMAALVAQFSWKIVDIHIKAHRRISLLNEAKNVLDSWLAGSAHATAIVEKNDINYLVTTRKNRPRIVVDDAEIAQLTVDGFCQVEVKATWQSIHDEIETYSIFSGIVL
ncbi:MAG TPA: hypothetical protein VGT41_06340 [Candidatus Babeliales bacterium]|nr:hypothetical protein [Candidatus Babeliales bacterium]